LAIETIGRVWALNGTELRRAAPIGTEEADHAAGLDPEGEVRHRLDCAEALAQTLDVDRGDCGFHAGRF